MYFNQTKKKIFYYCVGGNAVVHNRNVSNPEDGSTNGCDYKWASDPSANNQSEEKQLCEEPYTIYQPWRLCD
ncbi:hypothetical protein PPA04_17320 [Pediococcus parvulus]|nr:hypothetical protein PPA04_17320 [Pediococcus parvulus]